MRRKEKRGECPVARLPQAAGQFTSAASHSPMMIYFLRASGNVAMGALARTRDPISQMPGIDGGGPPPAAANLPCGAPEPASWEAGFLEAGFLNCAFDGLSAPDREPWAALGPREASLASHDPTMSSRHTSLDSGRAPKQTPAGTAGSIVNSEQSDRSKCGKTKKKATGEIK